MDFNLSDEQIELKKSLAELCDAEIAPAAGDTDRNEVFPEENWKKLAGQGIFGLMIPEEYGGQGKDLITGLVALEEVAAACASTAMAAGTSMWCAAKALELFASDTIKDKYLPGMAKGDIVGAFATTEAGAGSDLSAIATKAQKEKDSYVITGGKSYVTNAPAADFIIVLAKTSDDENPSFSTFLVPSDTEGLEIDPPMKTMGMRGAPASRVKIAGCSVPEENLLGEENKGLKMALGSIDYTRLSIAAISIGIARAAFFEGKKYAETRIAFGKPIGRFQDVSFRVADMHVESDVARQLMYHAGWQKQEGMKCAAMIAAAKISASEVAIRNANRAISILAGRGFIQGETVERLYRDAKLTEIAGGTSDILRQVISRDLLKD